jgi:peptidoglycan/LPS O-acetylase OafA/YrhL
MYLILNKNKYYNILFNLDILRSIAVVMVLLSQLPNLELPASYEQRRLGILSIVIFFKHINLNLHIILTFFLVCFSTLLISCIAFNFIARPFIKFGKKISDKY